jgi:DnaJ-class molecular chaperone
MNDIDQSEYDETPGWNVFGEPDDTCPTCGGEGHTEYLDDSGSWGEDCPSEVNHIVTCSNCRGSGRARDCSVL